jgi:ribosomal protein S13
MNIIEKAKHRRLMTLLSKAGFDDEARHQLVFTWTNGRTESTRQLTEEELSDIVWKLENDQTFSASPQHTVNAMMLVAIRQKRSTVLTIAQRCGIHEGTNFEKFNSFMANRSIYKKKLTEYTFTELDELIKQMHKLEANFKRSAKKAYSKAWHKHHGIPETSKN